MLNLVGADDFNGPLGEVYLTTLVVLSFSLSQIYEYFILHQLMHFSWIELEANTIPRKGDVMCPNKCMSGCAASSSFQLSRCG